MKVEVCVMIYLSSDYIHGLYTHINGYRVILLIINYSSRIMTIINSTSQNELSPTKQNIMFTFADLIYHDLYIAYKCFF